MTGKDSLSYPNKVVAVIVAAGSGIRLNSCRPKQFLDIDGTPLLAVTLMPFQSSNSVEAIVAVVPSGEVDYCHREIVERFKLDKVGHVIPGGKRRQDSVRLGLEATKGDYDLVLIHDGARPVIDVSLINRVIGEARGHRAVITGLPAKETVKEVDSRQEVVRTYDRGQMWLVQTPQVFRYKDIMEAHHVALREYREEGATDDSILVEQLGIPVKVIEGSEKNIKVTTPYDLELVRIMLKELG